MVRSSSSGTRNPRWSGVSYEAGCGELTVNAVLTTCPSGVMYPSRRSDPPAPSCATFAAGIGACEVSQRGAQAQTRNMWLRKEPPKAEWKKLSASTYLRASSPSGMLRAS